MRSGPLRELGLSASISVITISLYHLIFVSHNKIVDGPEYKGWRAGEYVVITTRSSTRAKPGGGAFFEYSWARIEAVSGDSLKVRTYYGTDDGDSREDNITNPRPLAGEASNIDFEKIRNISEWSTTWGPRKPFWLFR